MIHGRRPPRLDNGMGSWFTKLRDAVNPTKLIQTSAHITENVISKLGIEPLTAAVHQVTLITDKVDAERQRAEQNPAVIKTIGVIGAVVLSYFGQVSAAAALLDAANKYAEGVQAKKNLRNNIVEQKKDDDTADLINKLLPLMSPSDQVIVKNAYDQVGYKALDNSQVKSIVTKAQDVYDSLWSVSLKNHHSLLTNKASDLPTTTLLMTYVNQIIDQAITIPIKNEQLKSDTIEKALNSINDNLNMLNPSTANYIASQLNAKGANALQQKDVSDILIPIARAAMVIISQGVAIGSGQSPEQARITANNVVGNMTPTSNLSNYLPYIGVALAALIASSL